MTAQIIDQWLHNHHQKTGGSMTFYQKADREEKAVISQNKMAEALVEAWRKGECKLVKQTITGAQSPRMAEHWRDETAALLLPTERDYFNRYMRG